MRFFPRIRAFVAAAALLCGGLAPSWAAPPSAVTDLQVTAIVSTGLAASSMTVTLTWTAPGEEGGVGTLNNSTFSLRWSTVAPIVDDAGFDSASFSLDLATTAVEPGSLQGVTIPFLDAATSHYFVIKTTDSESLTSALSVGATAQSVQIIISNPVQLLANAVAAGDFNGSGRIDFAMQNAGGSSHMYIAKNDGDLIFSQLSQIARSGEDLFAAAVGDIDNDGDLDMVVGTEDTFAAYAAFNDGTGNFTAVAIDGATQPSRGVALGDYNRNGHLDFLLVNENQLDVLGVNDGAGNFSTYPVVGTQGASQGVAWGDYNNDGYLDAIVAVLGAESFLINNANGVLSTAAITGTSYNSYGVAWGDYNNDGHLDFALACDNCLTPIWKNNGNGTFSPIGIGTMIPGLRAVAWGDINGDGRLDLVGGRISGNRDVVLINGGGDAFTLLEIPSEGRDANGLALADFDGDGDLDIMTADNQAGDAFHRNDISAPNAAPAAPSAGFAASFSPYSSFASSGTLTLQWSAPADDTTPAAGLEYLVRLGTEPSQGGLLSLPAAYGLTSSFLYSTRLGGASRGIKLELQTETTVYWSVVGVDPSGARSTEAVEQSINLSAPAAVADLAVSQDSSIQTSSTAVITLVFTAPGENGTADDLGAAAQYDVRWTTGGPIDTQEKYLQAPRARLLSAQGTAGAPVSLKVSVDAGQTQYFAMTTIDSGGVRSGLSNAASHVVDGMRERVTDIASSAILQGNTTGFLKLELWTETGQVQWNRLRVFKEGSLPDAAISNIGIYRDNNLNGFFDSGDSLRSAAAVFVSSAAELVMNTAQIIDTSTKTYFVALIVNDSFLPVAGASVGVRLNGEAFRVSSGGVVGIDFPAIAFDGVDDRMISPYSASMDIGGASQGTLEAWVKTADGGADRSLITRGNTASGYRLWLNGETCGAGVPTLFVGSSFLCANDGAANVSIADGQWHHVAATFLAGTGRFFIDGQPLVSGAVAGTLSNSSSNLGIGGPNNSGGNYLAGEIDEVRISNFARYPAELPPARRNNTTGAVALYHFDTISSGTNTYADATSNNNALTLHGGARGYARSTTTHMLDAQDILFASSTDISPPLFFRNAAEVGVMKLELWTNHDFVSLRELSVEKIGTGNASGATNLQLFLDDGDGFFDAAADFTLASGLDFVLGKATFTLPSGNAQLIGKSTKTYFVSWDLTGDAEQTLGLRLAATTEFLLSGTTDTVSIENFPLETTPVNIVAAEVLVSVESPTGTWINTSSVVFQGRFDSGNVDHYHYLFDQFPATVLNGTEAQWSAGKTTVTATADADDWYFHVRAFDAFDTAGLQDDIGPFFIDRTDPTGGAFAHFNAAGAQLTESQFSDLAVSVTAQIDTADALSGLNINGPSPLAPSSGTVSLWHFDEAGGTWVDAGPANNFLTVGGGTPQRVAGRFGGGIQTTGGSYLNNASPAQLPLANAERTVEAWVLPRSTEGVDGIVSWGSGGGVFALQLNAGVLEADLGGATASAGPVLSTGVWQHVAFSFDGNFGRFYLNGAAVGSNAYGAQATTAGVLRVGRAASGDFDGTIDDLRISRRVIAAPEIIVDYELGNPYFVSYSTDAGRSWRVISATGSGTGRYVSLTGSHGTTAAQTLKVFGLDLIVSTLTATGAAATNQVRFHAGDVAGNAATLGPFGVLVDTNTPVAVSTPSIPGNGRYTGLTPDFYWTGPSTPLVQGLGGEFFMEVSNGDPGFAPGNMAISVAVPAVVSDAIAQQVTGVYNSTFTLTEGTTYYWRVRSRSSLGVFGEFGPVHSFVTDVTSPTESGFTVFNSTSGTFGQVDYIDLLAGVTVQLTVSDAVSGLSHNHAIAAPDGAIAHWRFSELDNGNPVDETGNGNTGTLACGTPGSCSPARLRATPRGAGIVCQSGRGMTASNANFNFPALSDFSVSAWINPTDVSGFKVIAALGAATTGFNSNWAFLIRNDRLQIVNATTGGPLGPVSIQAGVWQHVTASVQGGNVRFYLNGELNGQGSWSGNSGGGSMPFSACSGIQSDGVWESPFLGMIDDMVVFNKAVSAGEVAALYEASKPGGFSVEFSTTAGQIWNVISATAAQGGRPWVEIPGADGDIAARTLSVRDLRLTHSTNTAAGAAATNQLRFLIPDRSLNFITAGPYSVIVDTVAAAAVSTPTFPVSGAYVRRAPNFLWGGPSTATAAGMGAAAFYRLEVADNANFIGPAIVISTPVKIGSTNAFTTAGTYLSSQTLNTDTTYYWRVRAQDYLGLLSPALTVNTFVTDFSSPVFQSFVSINSTGGAAVESIGIDLLSGVTVQLRLQDAGPAGLATAPVGGVTPFGVLITTNGASAPNNDWNDGEFRRSFGPGGVSDAYALARFEGKLYAGVSGSGIHVYDGSSWTLSASLTGTGVVALREFNGELFAGQTGSGEIWKFDGGVWSLFFDHGGGETRALEAHGGRLYAATDGVIWVYDPAIGWSVSFNPADPVVFSLKSFAGELFAGANPNLYKFDGSSWTVSDFVSANVLALEEYNGRLFAATNDSGKIRVLSAGIWSTSVNPTSESVAGSLGRFGGRLYAGLHASGSVSRIYTYDGRDWMRVRTLANVNDVVFNFSEYAGRLYTAASAGSGEGIVFVTTPTFVSLTGADGSTGVETLEARGLTVLPSPNATTCGGVSGCTATNQVRFTYADKTGEGGSAGPFAILADPLLGAPTGYAPFSGDFIRSNTASLSWVEVATQPVHDIQIDRQADFAAPVDLDIQATTFHNVTTESTLLEATTYYWRVRGANAFGVRSEYSPTRSFVVDTQNPSTGVYRALNSTGGAVSEQNFINLSAGATVQLEVQDAGSGLGLSGFNSMARVGVWSFEGISGTTVTDRSGMGNKAILTSAGLRYEEGRTGRGVRFPDGINHVFVATPTVSAWSGLTIAGWVRPLANNSSFRTLWASKQFRFYAASNEGRVQFNYEIAPGQDGGCAFSTGQRHPLGAWLHVALVMDPAADRNRVYVDGVEEGSCVGAGAAADSSFSFGADAVSGIGALNLFTGDLDELRVFSRGLTPEELNKESLERGFSVEFSTTAGQYWSVVSSTFGAAGRLSHSGSDGSVALETVSAAGLSFTESTNTAVCSTLDGCGATNQVRFFVPDRAGNVRRVGPFAVLIDTSVPLPVMTSLTPLTTDSVFVTATGTDNLSGLDAFNFEASTSAAFAFPISSSGFITESTHTFTGLLSASTYYVRVTARDAVLNVSTPSVALATSTFGSVFFSSFAATPPAAGQGSNVAMLGFTLNTKAGVTSGFKGLTLKRTGVSKDADVAEVRIYRDDGDQIFSEDLDTDISPGSVVFIDSSAVVSLPIAEPLSVQKSTYFVVFRLAPDATVEGTLGVEISSASNVSVNFPAVAEGDFPIAGANIPISDGPNIMFFTRENFSPLVTQIQSGAVDFPVLKIQANTDIGTSLISSIVFRLQGNLPSNNIQRINVWRDAEPDGLFNAAADEKLTAGTDVFGPGRISTVTFNPALAPVSSRTVTTTQRLYFVTVDLAVSAPVDTEFSIQIDTESLVTLGNPEDAVAFASPGALQSTTMTVVLDNILSVNVVDTMPASLTQGQRYTVARASLAVDAANTTVDRIQIGRTGTGVDSDIAAVEIWHDKSPVGSPVNDVLLASGPFTAGLASLTFPQHTITAGTTEVYLIVYDVSGGANPGNTLGAQFGASAVRITNPNTALDAAFPFNTAAAPVAATVNQLLVTAVQDVSVGQPTQGVQHYPMLRMDIASSAGDFLWQNLVVEKLGTAASTDAAKVNIFRDFDGDGLFDVAVDTRITNDAQTFDAGGSVNLSLTQVQTVALSTRTYFVTLSIAPGAGAGPTIGLRIPTTAAFNLEAPNTTNPDMQAFPLNTSTPAISPFANTVSLTSASIVDAEGAEIGQANVGIMSLQLNTDISAASWQKLTLNQSGTAQKSDIDAVKLYFDFNGEGAWNPANVADFQLISSSTQTFDGSGNVTLSFSTPPVISATPSLFFLVLDISTSAVPDRSVVVRVSTGPNFAFNSPNKADPNAVFTSPPLGLKAPPVTMFLQGSSSAPATTTQGSKNVVMLTLSAWTDAFASEWSALRVARTGTGSDADVESVNIYLDRDGDGLLNAVADAPIIASAAVSGGSALLNFGSPETVTASTRTYFVAYNLSSVAQAGVTLGAAVAAAGDVDIDTPPNSVATTGFPLTSSIMSVAATQTGLFVSASNLAPGKLKQGATHQILLSLALHTTQHALAWNNLTLRSSGTATDSDIAAVNLWRDINNNGVIDVGTDTRITAGLNSFIGGTAVLSLSGVQVGQLPAQNYLVTVDVAPFAEPGRTISVVLESTAAFGVSSPNFVDAAAPAYPIASDINTEIEKVAEQIVFTAADVAPVGINQGSESAFVRLDARATRYRGEWKGLRVNKLGSLPDVEIAEISFYRDSDLSGSLSPGDLFIGSGSFSGAQADVVFSSAQTVGTSTAAYFAALRLPLSATVGTTVRLTFDAPDFSLASPDTPSQAAPFDGQSATVLDATTPAQPVVTVDGPFSSNFEFLHFVWSSTVSIGQLSGALYAVGSTPGGFDILNWTALAPNQTSVNASGFALLQATTYYVSVKAQANGRESPAGNSIPVLIDFSAPTAPAPGVTAGAEALLITWATVPGGPSGILGYLIEYRSEAKPVWINAKTGEQTGTLGLSGQSAMSPLGEIFTLALSSSQVVTGNSFQATGIPQGTVFVRMSAVSGSGVASSASEVIKVQLGPLPSGGIRGAVCYPNPFDSRSTTAKIYYELARASDVTITLYSVFGRELKKLTFAAGSTGGSAGANTVAWDGTDNSGGKVSKGMYIAVIEAGGARETLKIGVIH